MSRYHINRVEQCATGKEAMESGDIKPTVFVIDDEEIIRDMTTDMLTDMGYNVLTSGDGEQAIQLFQGVSNDINVVLLDMIMPGLSGPEILTELQRIKPDIKVILSSGFSIEEVPQHILAQENTDFIEKPYRLNELLDKIKHCVNL